MNNLFSFLLVPLMLFSGLVSAQTGTIRGVVYDDATGETLPVVTVLVEGTQQATMTDLDGTFSFKLQPGTYNLKLSFISYENLTVSGINVQDGKVVILDNLRLKEASTEIEEVVVTAQTVKNTETAIVTIKRKSASLMDGISSASFRKIGDSDAAASMKRVPGVTIQGGKYVFVRGLGDRYTKTILNGLDIPGLDPDRNTIQMDLFPTNIIDNIVVHKSFSANLPADFTGGVIDIALKAFPETKTATLSFSGGFNPTSHFNPNYLSYEGGKTDFLGFDDGTRAIPAKTNIPSFVEAISNSQNADRYKEILGAFNPTLAASKTTSLMDYSIGATLGNQKEYRKRTIGYNFALNYKSSTDFYEGAEFGKYGLQASNQTEMERREHTYGDYGQQNYLLSGLAGFAIKSNKNKIQLNLLHLQNGESQAGIFDFVSNDQGTTFESFQHVLDYKQRSMTNVFLAGKHTLTESNWTIEWKMSPTISKLNDPDVRFTRYNVELDGDYVIGTESGFPERTWRELSEINLANRIDLTKDLALFDQAAKLMFGGAYSYKNRDFAVYNFAVNIRDIPLTGNPNELFSPENLWPYQENINRGTGVDVSFLPNNPNEFNANTANMAAYTQLEFSPLKKVKTILGVRAENYVQRYTGQNQTGTKVLNNEAVLESVKLFPAVNIINSITDQQNIRFSFSQTIARPSFKELSYAEISDPISGTTFIGALFPDVDDVAGIVYWDGNLQSTDIFNYDLRWEYFMEQAQMVSVSAFYKQLKNPIEMVQFATQVGSYQPRNVGDGELFGVEFELNKNLGALSGSLSNFDFTTNLSYITSQVKLSETEYESRVANKRDGQTIGEYRVMAGQSPYIINTGLAYNGGDDGFWKNFEAGVYYNVQGETLLYVGINDRPDVYTLPFHSLNFTANKAFGEEKKLSTGFKASNLLNAKKESVFKSHDAQDQIYQSLTPGMTFSVSVKYAIF